MAMRRRKKKEVPELDVTVMINLMVVLVAFLLVSAVFSRITVIELNLPSGGAGGSHAGQALNLEVIIHKDALEVSNRGVGLIKRIDKGTQGYNFPMLSRVMVEIKNRFPQKEDVTILSEADVNYDTLVQVMDAVRTAKVFQSGSSVSVSLFPKIAIGDAAAR